MVPEEENREVPLPKADWLRLTGGLEVASDLTPRLDHGGPSRVAINL